VAAAVALLLVVTGAVGVVWWRHAHRDGLAAALRLVPEDVQRYSWTDWAGVRRALSVEDDRLSGTALAAFLAKGFDADLTSASAMVTSAEPLQAELGFSPATARWELFAQSEAGAVVVVQPAGTDGLERRLRRAGYTQGGHGIWDGEDVAASLGITPEFSHVAIHDGRVLGSDSADYLEQLLAGGFAPSGAVGDVAQAVGHPLSAVIYSGDYACGHLAMSQADDADQAQGVELVRQAGGVDPLTAFAMGVADGSTGTSGSTSRDVTVAMGFESHDQAVRNADARAALAGGPAPGQGGDFGDRFRLGRVQARDDVVTMQLHPRKGAYVLSDLSTGPVLFATC
jgi:hypothetical protein